MDALAVADLQKRLVAMHPIELESTLREALQRQGFLVEHFSSRSRDNNIDLVATRQTEQYAIQVLRRIVLREEEVSTKAPAPNQHPHVRRVIASPGVATVGAQQSARQLGVELWLLDRWAALLDTSPLARTHTTTTAARPELSGDASQQFRIRADSLISRLHETPVGEGHGLGYQEVVADIADFLFAPALGPTDRESSDEDARNRRDFIMENLAEDGFWLRARTRYHADYIVFDAKNYSQPIKKQSVIEIAHYLKPYGLGMFAILFTRKFPHASARHAAREQWAGGARMIVILDDDNTTLMLERKRDGTAPESVISDCIATMRKGM
jgi:hypothetical protein